jgi:hypothetical protein
MRRSFIGKRRRDKLSPFANVEVHLLEPRLESRHHAVTNVDPIGVIEHFTFADVAREVGRWAHLLRVSRLQPGDRVVVLAGREWAWRCALLGVLRAGGVAVPCPASLPVEEIRAIAASAGAGHLISIPAQPDLAGADGIAVLDADGIDSIDASGALQEPAHESLRDDVALVLYARRADGLRGAMHTHASLIAQADAGTHWLGVGEGEPVWCTAADGSPESIWLLLAGWQAGANIVNVDLELDPEAMLELIGRLGTAAVWFSDEEYERLGSAAPAAWNNGSINRALLSDERASGATAFAHAVGTNVAAVFGLVELGVVAGWPAGTEGEDTTLTARPVPGIELSVVGEQGARLTAGLAGDIVVRSDAPSLITGYSGAPDAVPPAGEWFLLGWQGSLGADGLLELNSRSSGKLEPLEARVEAERRRREDEEARELAEAAHAERTRREADAADELRQKEEARRRAEQQARERVQAEVAAWAARETAAAEERRRAGEAERARREAAVAEERRRAEEEQRREEERRREEETRRRAQQEARRLGEAAAAAEALRAEHTRREAAAAEERRRAEEEKRREEERRQKEEARRRAEQQAREREQAEVAAWAARETAEAEERRPAVEAERARRESAAAEKRHREQMEAGRHAQRADTAGARANRKAARTTNQRRTKQARPRERPPRVWLWQLLSLILLLVSGALIGAYFLTRPDHEAAASPKAPHVTNRKSKSPTGAVSGQARAPARKANRTKTTTSSQRLHVPNTVGLSKAMASKKLEAAGFSVFVKYVASQVPHGEAISQRTLELGQVVRQTPAGEIPVKSGRKVLLVISLRPRRRIAR